MPSYNILDQQRQGNNANNNANNQDDNQNEAANNRPGMNQFLTRLREFLSTVELHFPAEPNLNNNNNGNNPNGDADQDDDEVEYD